MNDVETTTGVQFTMRVSKKNPLVSEAVPNEVSPGDRVDDTKPPPASKELPPPAPTPPTPPSKKNTLRPDHLLDEDSKPPASKSATLPVPTRPKPHPQATRGVRADSTGMTVALISQRFKPKRRVKGGAGRGRGHKGEEW